MATPITSVTCMSLTRIDGTDCIGDSRQIINDNTLEIGTTLCDIAENTIYPVTSDTIIHDFDTTGRTLSSEIRNNSITSDMLTDDSVTTAKLSAGVVTTDKIALSAVTTQTIANSAVTQEKLAVNVAGTGPVFRANATGTTSVAQGVPTKVTLDTEQYDTNNNFSSSRFTPTIPGYYQINFQIRMEAKQDAWALLYKNGAGFSTGSVTSGLNYISTGSDVVYMNGSTDYIELFAVHQSAGSQNVTAAVMSGFLARSA